jgi:hypothetical protein
MIANVSTPIGPAVLVFQLKYLFNCEISGILGIGKVQHPEAAAPYIGYGIAGLQVFPLRYAGNGTVKMDRNPGDSVGNRRGYVLDGFAAKGTIRDGYRFGGYLGRRPAGALKKRIAFPAA